MSSPPVTSLLQTMSPLKSVTEFCRASVEKKSTGSALQLDQDVCLRPCCQLLSTRERWEDQDQTCVLLLQFAIAVLFRAFCLAEAGCQLIFPHLSLLSMHKPLNLGFGFHYKSKATKRSVIQALFVPWKKLWELFSWTKFHGWYLCMCIGAHSIPSVVASLRAIMES